MVEIPFSGIKKIEAIASKPGYISLSQGAIKVGGIPHEIKEHLQQLLNTDKTDYYQSCWGIQELRTELTNYINKNYDPTITEKQILPTHGAIGGLSLLFLALLEAGDEIIIPEPAYPAYTILAQAARCKPVYVSSLVSGNQAGEEIKWDLDLEKIKQATTPKTKLLIFSNPWNPLGKIIPVEKINELISWCEKHGIYLVLDEAYRNYVFAGEYTSGLSLVNKSDKVICVSTFSKNLGMSGWRIGYLAVPEAITYALAGMQDALMNCLNNLAQHAGLYAIKHPELEKPFHEIIKENRTRALELLQPLVQTGVISLQEPDGGFFLFVKTQHADASDLAMDILEKAKVGTVPGSAFGKTGKPFLRICFARETAVLEEGMRRFVGYFE